MAGSTQLPDNHPIGPNTVGASLLAKNVNDNACFLNKRGAYGFFASKLAPKTYCSYPINAPPTIPQPDPTTPTDHSPYEYPPTTTAETYAPRETGPQPQNMARNVMHRATCRQCSAIYGRNCATQRG